MKSEALQKVADSLPDVERALFEMKELISVMRESGESIDEYMTKYQELERRYNRWKKALEARGYHARPVSAK
ncbi:MAG: hypothetical protein QXQ02_03120 [Halobacteria archaeon]